MSVIAFHEKAPVGVKSILDGLRWSLGFLSAESAAVAMLPSALSRSDSCSLGACWAFSFQLVLPSVCRPVLLDSESVKYLLEFILFPPRREHCRTCSSTVKLNCEDGLTFSAKLLPVLTVCAELGWHSV